MSYPRRESLFDEWYKYVKILTCFVRCMKEQRYILISVGNHCSPPRAMSLKDSGHGGGFWIWYLRVSYGCKVILKVLVLVMGNYYKIIFKFKHLKKSCQPTKIKYLLSFKRQKVFEVNVSIERGGGFLETFLFESISLNILKYFWESLKMIFQLYR